MLAHAAFVVGIMTTVVPPEKFAYLPRIGPEAEETEAEMRARYEDFAKDLVAVNFDPAEKPLFSGPFARTRTMEYELAILWHESGFSKDVDRGPCVKKAGRCDGGLSFCSAQIRLGKGTTAEGWTGQDLFDDRKKCFRAALHLMRRSAVACRNEPEDERLAGYAAGDCKSPMGKLRSRELFAMYKQIRARFREPGPDRLYFDELLSASTRPGAPPGPFARADK